MTAWRNNSIPRLDTLLLVLIAAGGWTVVRTCAAWNPTLMSIRALIELTLTLAFSFVLSRRANTLRQARSFAAVAIGVVVAYPFLAELALRKLAGGSEPLEMLLLTGLQLTAIVLAVFSHLPRLGGTAVLFSSFLFLFISTMPSNRIALVLSGLFGMLVLWWLMGAYWDRLSGTFVASKVERRIPMRVSVVGVTVAVMLILVAMIGTTGGAAIALPGFMPTSGGTRWYDPHARSGVGDGDATVAATDHAMSFGAVDSELFLDSEMPTLYDMFSDLYGDPPKPNNRHERAVSLSSDDPNDAHHRMANNEKSGREFSTIRRKVDRGHQELDDREAPAMLYVVGRVPLHLTLERFDTFDGRVWKSSDDHIAEHTIHLEEENGKHWAYLKDYVPSPIHRGIEPHAIKVVNLKSNRFASPPQLMSVHIDKVKSLDFFGWTDDGVACMPVRDHIPQLTVVHLRSRGVNLQPLRETDFTESYPVVSENRSAEEPTATDIQAARIARHLEVEVPSRTVSETAKNWTSDVPRGWQQVEAVVEKLRNDFVLDPNAEAPEDCSDVVSHFLRVRRGPSYLFATTAAILLRDQGYPTRLVGGFYAREDRYDHRAGQTSILAEDAHVWVEVNVDGRMWIPIEPTPGYEHPNESLTWRQHIALAWNAIWIWCGTHLVELLLGLVILVTGWFTRVAWLDFTIMWAFRLVGTVDRRRNALWTMRLLEWRAWLAGHRRPKSKTLSHWHGVLVNSLPEATAKCLQSVLRSAESLLYSSNSSDNATVTKQLIADCAVVQHRIGTNCFRQAFAKKDSESER